MLPRCLGASPMRDCTMYLYEAEPTRRIATKGQTLRGERPGVGFGPDA